MEEVAALRNRLDRLERQARWWQGLALVSTLALTGLTAMAQMGPPGPHRAQAYDLVDARGRVLGSLASDQGFPGLRLLDDEGRVTARFGLTPGGPSLRIVDPDGNVREFLGTKPGVRPATP